MENKYVISEQNWDFILYLINNFYKPVEVRGNSVKFERLNSVYGLFDIGPEFYYGTRMDKVDTLIVNDEFIQKNRYNVEFRKKVERFVRNEYKMNQALNAERNIGEDYKSYFEDAKNRLIAHQTSKIETINSFLDVLYGNLSPSDRSKINMQKNENLIYCVENNIISREFAKSEFQRMNSSSYEIMR